MKILICDDHPLFCEGLDYALRKHGLEVVCVGSAHEALAAVQSDESLDLVLLDLTMPGVDGWSALERLRAEHPTLPVAVISASERGADARRALDMGAAGFIPKSSRSELLYAAITVIVSGSVYVPSFALQAADASPVSLPGKRHLTERQQEILDLIACGLTNAEIAHALGVALGTVKSHVSAILGVLDVANRTEAVSVTRASHSGSH